MAEVVLEGVLGHLSSPVGKELGLFLGFDQDLERLTRFVALQIGCLDGSAVSDKVNLELDSEGRGTVADVVMEATADGDMGDLLGADVGCTEGGELARIKIGVDVVHPLMMPTSASPPFLKPCVASPSSKSLAIAPSFKFFTIAPFRRSL
ncbi:hypothetical protein glysoja_042828 [Glycine soja]|uniref:Uncharacterized protein n=1 Tax=Glycine soja TaxID=3848 RepID=A0A0B2QBK4_GLYSO|nr:hypothetical protein glysoja_042828 [Glycine soja]